MAGEVYFVAQLPPLGTPTSTYYMKRYPRVNGSLFPCWNFQNTGGEQFANYNDALAALLQARDVMAAIGSGSMLIPNMVVVVVDGPIVPNADNTLRIRTVGTSLADPALAGISPVDQFGKPVELWSAVGALNYGYAPNTPASLDAAVAKLVSLQGNGKYYAFLNVIA